MKKVSIIVPCYNSSSYVDRCMDSLINQTIDSFEIVLVDDGSTDDTLVKLKKYRKEYSDKVVLVTLDKNMGLGNARNIGIKHSSGEYIGFVDSDDYVDLNMFEVMYNKASKNNSSVVECNFIWEFPNKNKIDITNGYELGSEMLVNVRVMVCNKIYKKKWLDEINPLFAVGLKYEDVLFTYEYVPYVKSVSFVDEAFYHYVQRKSSLANNQNIRVRDIYDVLLQVRDYYVKNKIYDEYKNELEYLFVRYILGSSYKRACKIKDKKVRNKVLDEGWKLLNDLYPNWKKNAYLKTGVKNIYFKMINYFFYKFNTIIFRML
mgnify:CR=1 FL=1